MKLQLLVSCLGILASAVLAFSQDQGDISTVNPGQTVQVQMSKDSPGKTIYVSFISQEKTCSDSGGNGNQGTCTVQNDSSDGASCKAKVPIDGVTGRTFSLGIPASLCPKLYKIVASTDPGPSGSTGTGSNGASTDTNSSPNINISPQYIRVAERQATVTGIDPKAIYYDDGTGTGVDRVRSFAFLGPTSLKKSGNYSLRFKDRALARCDEKRIFTNCYEIDSDESQDGQIKVQLKGETVLDGLTGPQTLYLVHNGTDSDPQKLIFVDKAQSTSRNWALAVVVGIVILVYLILLAGRKGLQGDTRSWLLTQLFLDEETCSYSLSKCQFYAWTLVSILGYVYLAVSKSYVQGSAVFPDIPDGLPGILLASAGTSVLATGITSAKGSKGAGLDHPTLADFVTSGGVVAPERLQFVVWTIVGIFTFLTIVFKSDPLTISSLPKIPNGFLELMGISSAGYLGGKLARKAGPVIKNNAATVVHALDTELAAGEDFPKEYSVDNRPTLVGTVLTLNIEGENLDPQAQVKVDGQTLRKDQYWIKAPEPPDPQTKFCNHLYISLNGAEAYLDGKPHMLTFVNSDSQAADASFPRDLMAIDSISEPDKDGNLTVTGKNFVSPTKYVWRNAQSQFIDDGVARGGPALMTDSKVQGATQLTVDRPKVATAGSTLYLVSPVGLVVKKTV